MPSTPIPVLAKVAAPEGRLQIFSPAIPKTTPPAPPPARDRDRERDKVEKDERRPSAEAKSPEWLRGIVPWMTVTGTGGNNSSPGGGESEDESRGGAGSRRSISPTKSTMSRRSTLSTKSRRANLIGASGRFGGKASTGTGTMGGTGSRVDKPETRQGVLSPSTLSPSSTLSPVSPVLELELEVESPVPPPKSLISTVRPRMGELQGHGSDQVQHLESDRSIPAITVQSSAGSHSSQQGDGALSPERYPSQPNVRRAKGRLKEEEGQSPDGSVKTDRSSS
jgi:hypothetical protein